MWRLANGLSYGTPVVQNCRHQHPTKGNAGNSYDNSHLELVTHFLDLAFDGYKLPTKSAQHSNKLSGKVWTLKKMGT